MTDQLRRWVLKKLGHNEVSPFNYENIEGTGSAIAARKQWKINMYFWNFEGKLNFFKIYFPLNKCELYGDGTSDFEGGCKVVYFVSAYGDRAL